MERFFTFLEAELPVCHGLLTKRLGATLCAVALFFLALQWGFYGIVLAGAENLITSFGLVVGGDFVVFHEAGKTPAEARAALYDFDELNARLAASFPHHGDFRLAWQYPPTFYFFAAPFGTLPYPIAYSAWIIVGAGLLLASLAKRGASPLTLLLVAASPALFQTAITGQTGLFTAALFVLAGLSPDKRPFVAGVAAGLLTLKPQLGLLIPVAYIACGAWRAFAVAAATAIGLALSAYGLFGETLWTAFVEAATAQSERMGETIVPVKKLTSPFGGATTLGLSAGIGFALQAISTAGLAALVAVVWRRSPSPETRFAVLACASVLAAPYVFYYELPIALAGLALLANRAAKTGLAPYEGLTLAALWLTPMFMPGDAPPSVPIVFLAASAALAIAVRRFLIEDGLSGTTGAHGRGDGALVEEIELAADGHALR
ncbi:MAG: glycosyltransferase family 87 protein [Pseudomonadota bacterium]